MILICRSAFHQGVTSCSGGARFCGRRRSDPGWPGIANGHNKQIAFGRTNFFINPDDLYVLETKPNDPDSYRRGDSWQRFETVEEEIQVKSAVPTCVKLKYSELGPVISEQPSQHQALVVRSSWMAQPGASMLSQLPYNFASDWPSFLRAIRSYPQGTSFMYADVSGNIGWQAAGWVPIRPQHDGLLPVPGDGRYDWSGLIPLDQLPSALNPKRGWLANGKSDEPGAGLSGGGTKNRFRLVSPGPIPADQQGA